MESLNRGHFRTASLVLCKEDVLFERFKMYCSYKEKIFWDLKAVSFVHMEVVLILECPLAKASLYTVDVCWYSL